MGTPSGFDFGAEGGLGAVSFAQPAASYYATAMAYEAEHDMWAARV
jgi:hypothetical protein